ncbi:MAG TPA: glycosyltransferase family 39 protein [Chthonomonadales bacterium]|nr:glycosyltransferase family 39 protein [Chthonomonadales bacterium]
MTHRNPSEPALATPAPRAPTWRGAAVLALVCGLCFFWRLGSVGVLDFNEGLYLSAAREMVLRGDWVTPRANGDTFYHKPPLALWSSGLFFLAFGINEWAARLPVALATALLAFLAYVLGARLLGERAGLLGACGFCVAPLVVGTERQMTMDMHQSLWVGVAFAAFWAGYTHDRRWYMGFWAGMALAFLSKSAPGLFPLPLVAAFVVWDQRGDLRASIRRLRETRPLLGALLFLAIVAPWHVAATLASGRHFWDEYFFLHHVGILTGSEFGHVRPWWYYLPSLAWGLFPLSFFLPAGVWLAARWPGATEEEARGRRFLLVWAVGFVLMFTLMPSKLHSYLLPMYAAAALLAADWIVRSALAGRRWPAAIGWTVAVAACVGGTLAAQSAVARVAGTPLEADMLQHASPAMLSAAFTGLWMLAAGLAAAAMLAFAGRGMAAGAAGVGAMVVFLGYGVERILPLYDAHVSRDLHTLSADAGRRAEAGAPLLIHIFQPIRPSLFFYMPESVARRPWNPETGVVFPVVSEPEGAAAWAAANPGGLVLTEERRMAALLAAAPDLRLERALGRWRLLATPTEPR